MTPQRLRLALAVAAACVLALKPSSTLGGGSDFDPLLADGSNCDSLLRERSPAVMASKWRKARFAERIAPSNEATKKAVGADATISWK